MPLKKEIKKVYFKFRRLIGLPLWDTGISTFAIAPSRISELRAEAKTDIERLFYDHQGREVGKWVHYLPIYERYFAPRRGSAVRMLEIGVSHGGSLELWRRYFGPTATIFGIDIDPACARRFDPPNQVRIGSQDNPAFLESVVREMGGLDIVLDDGSHVGRHQIASFRTLFPLLAEGGLYLIEDLHASYWAEAGGGVRRPGTAIEYVKTMIDDLHGWYHFKALGTPAKDEIGFVHFYDSMVVIEKRRRLRPGHIRVGRRTP